MKIGQAVRDDGPQTHLAKAGTPTMGGALILVSITVTTLLWGDLANRFVWVTLLVTVGFGAIGWVDDYRKVVHRNPKGLSRASEIPLAIGDRTHRRGLSRVFGFRAGQRAFRADVPRVDRQRLQPLAAAQGRPHRPVRQDDLLPAGRLGLHRAHVLRDRRHEQRRQPDRRPRRTRHHADGDDRRGARHLRVRERQRDLRAVSAVSVHPRRGRARRDLRRDGGRRPGLPVVQRVSRGSVHGRRRRARAGRGARHDRGDRPPGDRALHHGRRVRRRDAVRDRSRSRRSS